jgi:hypothetical protein
LLSSTPFPGFRPLVAIVPLIIHLRPLVFKCCSAFLTHVG